MLIEIKGSRLRVIIILIILDLTYFIFYFATNIFLSPFYGGVVAQSVERATPGKEVLGSILAVAARFLLIGSVAA